MSSFEKWCKFESECQYADWKCGDIKHSICKNAYNAGRQDVINEVRDIINSVERKDLTVGNNYLCDVICKADLLQKLKQMERIDE